MRVIPILGLVFFLKYLYINCSYRALLIIANGLLCHGLKPKYLIMKAIPKKSNTSAHMTPYVRY